jgi:hypothetical protein
MANTQIKQILNAHSVPFYEKAGGIYADSMIGGTALFEETINVTNWNRAQLLSWLGY